MVVSRFQSDVTPGTLAVANVCVPSWVSRLTVSGPASGALAFAKKDTR